jgi:hypothetical protein
MYLSTQQLMVMQPDPVMTPMEFGWPEVRKGLHRILGGYLLAIGLVLFGAGVLGFIVYMFVTSRNVLESALDAAMILYLTAAICFLGGLYSFFLVISGKLRCLIAAPERCGAKWIMFTSILCFAFGPVLNFTSNFFISHAKTQQQDAKAVLAMMQSMQGYTQSLFKMDARAYFSLAGNLASIASTVFFVIFLRQASRCFDDGPRMRLAEFYLIFTGVVIAGTVFLVWRLVHILQDVVLPAPGSGKGFVFPPGTQRELDTLPVAGLLVGVAWLVSLLWYFMLIVSTSRGIAQGLAIRQAALQMAGMKISE